MKALTVRDPWATAIAEYGKSPENRSWRTHYRGPVAIHCGLGFDRAGAKDPRVIRAALDSMERDGWKLRGTRADTESVYALYGMAPDLFTARGKVLGVSMLVGVHHAHECEDGAGLCSPWAMKGMWHWVLTDFAPLREPIVATGRQGLWTPDTDLANAIISTTTTGPDRGSVPF